MVTDKPAIPRKNLPWAGKQVRPEQIEDELTFLWHLAADNMRISQNMNVRTSVLNLLICAFDTQSAYTVSSLLRDMASTHIARVTLVILDQNKDAPTEVTTWVTLRSFPVISDVMRHHFEQVTISLSGEAVRHATTIVQPLLKPDLPIYLWWTDDLPDDPALFQRMIGVSDRAIIDSSDFLTPTESICQLATLLEATPDCAVSDLNWSRLTPWRELIAQFSDIAEHRPYLVNVEKLEIEHAVAPGDGNRQNEWKSASPNPIRALFLAAWLKTRLGWRHAEETEGDFTDAASGTYRWQMLDRVPTSRLANPLVKQTNSHRTISGLEIIVRPRVQAALRPGNICLIRATGSYAGKRAVFTINRGDDDAHVITSVELPGATIPPPRVVDITATQKEGELLSDELEIMGHDQLYEQTLREVFSLLTQ
jgi:glucose-6-phosphate dehydrogenase assembly protein OpcA